MKRFRFKSPKHIHRLRVFVLLLCLSGTVLPCCGSSASGLSIDQIHSFDEMKSDLALMTASIAEARKKKTFSYALQKEMLTKAGACVSRLAQLCRTNQGAPNSIRQEGIALFSANRDIIRQILSINEETIKKFQETTLDTLEDPRAFFQSPGWRQPRQLISLSSYWLGWNGYYASLVIPEESPRRKQMLLEAVDGFSRAFIDFENDAIVSKSLYGRGLCYLQLKNYPSALYDFQSVRDKVKKGGGLYARSLYQEALIGFETGNFSLVLGKLDQIEDACAGGAIPDYLASGMHELRANVLLAQFGKTAESSGGRKRVPAKDAMNLFKKMKPLAVCHGQINRVFYQFVQTHADALEHLPYSDAGPVATLAFGDRHYERAEYDRALDDYQRLLAEPALPFNQSMDRLFYRSAYIYFEKKQWSEALSLLNPFQAKFPGSQLAKQAASLCYAAAAGNYQHNGESAAYEQYIRSIIAFLAICDDCKGRSDAHFRLGRYYREKGNIEQARNAFSKVGEDSPSFYRSQYYLLASWVEQLDTLKQSGRSETEAATGLYRQGLRVIDTYRKAGHKATTTGIKEKNAPHMTVLQARLYLYGSPDDWEKGLQLLEGFEQRYPAEKALFQDSVNLRLEYKLLLQKTKAFEAEIDGIVNAPNLDPSRYADLQELADRFYKQSNQTDGEADDPLSSRYASAALALYRKLLNVSMENRSYGEYCDAIELRMAKICLNRKWVDRAAEHYLAILRRNPKSADAVYGLGLVYETRGQWQKALEAWRRFSNGVEQGTYYWYQSRYRTAVALQKLGRTDKACTVIGMTLVLHPDLSDAELEQAFLNFKAERCTKETGK